MLGSDFVRTFAKKGPDAWEAAAVDLARQGALCPWPLYELVLKDDQGNVAVLTLDTDGITVGTFEDHVRLPMRPIPAQTIFNLTGRLFPTPRIVFAEYLQTPLKLEPITYWPNKGADLLQYATHSGAVDAQKGASRLYASGTGKNVVMSNIYKPGTVLIQGMYRPPPAPAVFDDHKPLAANDRQPIQPNSNAHGDFYVDYSHTMQGVLPVCVVNGKEMLTEELYRHPELSRLVSHEGPLRTVRYPSKEPVAPAGHVVTAQGGLDFARGPGALDRGFAFAEALARKNS